VNKGLRACGPARLVVSALLETTYVVRDVFDPMAVEPSRIILSAHRTVTPSQKLDEIPMLTGLYPPIVVLLDSSSTPASL